MNGTGKYTPKITYNKEATPEDYEDITISFNFESGIKGMTFRFEWQPNSDITVWYLCHYNLQEKTFTKKIAIFDEPRKAGEYIEDESTVKEYLEEYNISADDLDSHYDDIVNQLVLKDWCSIYDSSYSPDDYGEVTVETQWENW